jgi:pimeloyl-ACP methyl ester carboxylesterase
MIQEVPVAFGHRQALSGILLEPRRPFRDVAMLFLNAGIVHRVGPNRCHVSLARSLAERGIASLRFDLSGLGESEPASTDLGYNERVLSEMRSAMSLLAERLGIRKVALFGICSGADSGLSIARAEPRVVGAILAEVYSADSPSFAFRQKLARALYARTWGRALRHPITIARGLTRPWAGASISNGNPPVEVSQDRLGEFRGWKDVVRDIQAVVGESRRILLVYSKNDISYYNFRHLLSRHLVEGPFLRVAVIGGTNHTFAPRAAHEKLTQVTVDWTLNLADAEETPGRQRVHEVLV